MNATARRPDPHMARFAEDLVVAGLHTLSRHAKRRDDEDALQSLAKAHDWLLTRIAEELRARGA